MTCRNCGNVMPAGERFCGNCGQPMADSGPAPAAYVGPEPPSAARAEGSPNPQGPGQPTTNLGPGTTPPTYNPPPYTGPAAAPPPAYNQPPTYNPPPAAAPSPVYNQPPAYNQPPTYNPAPIAPAPPAYPQPQPGYGPTPAGYGMAAAKDPNTALLIEIIAGLFGFLGIGHLYAGRTNIGIALLLGWWVFLFVEVLLFVVAIGFCLTPLNLIVPIASGIWLKNEMTRAAGGPVRTM